MKYRKIGLLIMASVFCLAMTQIAGANAVVKTLYVDGAKVGQSLTGPSELTYLFNQLTVGCEGSQWYRYNGYKGQLDDFAVYSGILSDARIAAHYTANTNKATYEASVSTDTPLLYLKVDEAVKNNGSPAANAGTSAQLSGVYYSSTGTMTSVVDRFGTANGAVNLRGADSGNGDCVGVSDGNGVISLPSITVELWVHVDANTSAEYPRFFQHNNGTTLMGSYGGMFVADTCAVGLIGGGNTGYITKNLKDDNWHQVDITYQSDILPYSDLYTQEVLADNPRVYLQMSSDTPADSIHHQWYYWSRSRGIDPLYMPTMITYVAGAQSGESPLRVKAEYNTGGIGNQSLYFDGTPLPNSSATQSDDDIAIETPYGSYANWGLPSAGGDWARCADDPNLSFVGTVEPNGHYYGGGDVSYEFWFKNAPPGRYHIPDSSQGFFFQQWGHVRDANFDPSRAPGMGVESNSIIIACGVPIPRYTAGDYNTVTRFWYPGKTLDKNSDYRWHQIVLEYDVNGPGDPCDEPRDPNHYNSMVVKFYFDGVLYNSIQAIDPNGLQQARTGPWLNHMMIGAENDIGWGYNAISGYMQEFAIYPGLLSADRVLAHYAAWQPKNCIEAVARGYKIATDLNGDCKIDFKDFAIFASNWTRCNQPGGANCSPNW